MAEKPSSSGADAGVEIRVDPDVDDDDGGSDAEDALSSTATINTTILEYRKLHGRTYENFGGAEYWAPNDSRQNEGLDMTHHMLYLAHDNKLFLSPLENPLKVLDVGTGTGIWAIDFAEEFPLASVIGTDLSPIQPAWTPPNCRFELDDASQTWAHADNSLDYIHIRNLLGSIRDWPQLYRECFRCLKPGGWLEHTDFSPRVSSDDGSLPAENAWFEWRDLFFEAGEKMGRTFAVTDHFVKWVEEAGFSAPIQTNKTKLPVGTWPADERWKEVGLFNKICTEQGLEGYSLYICTTILGWSYEECQLLLARIRNAVRNPEYHAYIPCNTVYTQKPENL